MVDHRAVHPEAVAHRHHLLHLQAPVTALRVTVLPLLQVLQAGVHEALTAAVPAAMIPVRVIHLPPPLVEAAIHHRLAAILNRVRAAPAQAHQALLIIQLR